MDIYRNFRKKKVEMLRMYLFAPLNRGVVSIPGNLYTVTLASLMNNITVDLAV